MIPSLIRKQPFNGLTLELSQHLAQAGSQGEVEVGDSSRTVCPFVNSNYQATSNHGKFVKAYGYVRAL